MVFLECPVILSQIEVTIYTRKKKLITSPFRYLHSNDIFFFASAFK